MLVHVFIYLELPSQHLFNSVCTGNTKYVEHLLALGVEPDLPFGPLNQTPLYHAVKRSDTYIMQLLLDRGAAINKRNDLNQTPLHVAVLEKNISAIRLLLSRGAEPSARDIKNETPLDLARRENYEEVTELLMGYSESVEKE